MTRPPRQAIRNAKYAALPHWPGETQASPVSAIAATSPKFVGLNICLPFLRKMNLLAIVKMAAVTAIETKFVRRRRQRLRLEVSALLGSKAGSFQTQLQTYCVKSAAVRMAVALLRVISKSRKRAP